jgi:hypothetical protein
MHLKTFLTALMQLNIGETNGYAQQEISKVVRPFTFCSRIRKWEDITVDEMYVVLAVFMLMGIEQKPTLISYCYICEVSLDTQQFLMA